MPSRAERRSGQAGGKSHLGTYIAIGVVAVVVVVAIVIAVVMSNGSGSSDFDPAAHSVQLSGSPLIPFVSSDDSAVGAQTPTIRGTNFDGDTVQVVPDGTPTIIMFLAHWCPHCQREVGWLAPWFVENGLPSDVRIFSVITSIDEAAPNYPPDTWLKDVDWKVPVIVDDTESKAAAYFGLSAFPYWVILNGDGTVRERFTGEVEIDQFEQLLQELRS